MGLYLAVFDGDEELEGVEVGSYADFAAFRDAVATSVEQGNRGSLCPVLMNHSDSKGVWSAAEAGILAVELSLVSSKMRAAPPIAFNSPWKSAIAAEFKIKPANLLECFFDVDGIPLTERLIRLAEVSVAANRPIHFQ